MSDEGLSFWASMMLPDGLVRQETTNRADLLAWIRAHRPTGAVVELGMSAHGPAVPAMLAAMALAAWRELQTRSSERVTIRLGIHRCVRLAGPRRRARLVCLDCGADVSRVPMSGCAGNLMPRVRARVNMLVYDRTGRGDLGMEPRPSLREPGECRRASVEAATR